MAIWPVSSSDFRLEWTSSLPFRGFEGGFLVTLGRDWHLLCAVTRWGRTSSVVVASALACSPAHAAGVQHQPPPKLSDTGLYKDAAVRAIAAGVRPYSPQYPLWADGASKLRWVSLPKGRTIDATDRDAWRFPVGTRFWKEFSFSGQKVETRYIEKTGKDTWIFATYALDDQQREATLAPSATGLKTTSRLRLACGTTFPRSAIAKPAMKAWAGTRCWALGHCNFRPIAILSPPTPSPSPLVRSILRSS